MAKKTSTSKDSVLTIAQPTQQDIPAFLKQVDAKITELKGGQENKETTSGTEFPDFGYLKRLEKVEMLVKAHSTLLAKEKAYNASAKVLGIDVKKYPFQLNGFSLNSWETDIKSRLLIVKNQTELAKLEKVKKILEENLSQEAKLSNDLKKAQKILLDEI